MFNDNWYLNTLIDSGERRAAKIGESYGIMDKNGIVSVASTGHQLEKWPNNTIWKSLSLTKLPEGKRWKTKDELGEIQWVPGGGAAHLSGYFNVIDTGEVRVPKKGEYYKSISGITKQKYDDSGVEARIFKPIELEDLITEKEAEINYHTS